MTHLRLTTLATLLASTTLIVACNTAPTMPMGMGTTTSHNMTAPSHMAEMDAHMKTMQSMHEKMMNAKNPEERNALMAEHIKVMQDGMAMMEGMGEMQGKSATSGDMPMHHQMMEKHMKMMKSMMQMMQDRMPVAPAK